MEVAAKGITNSEKRLAHSKERKGFIASLCMGYSNVDGVDAAGHKFALRVKAF